MSGDINIWSPNEHITLQTRLLPGLQQLTHQVYEIIERIYFISPYETTSHFTPKVLYTMASDENDKTNI